MFETTSQYRIVPTWVFPKIRGFSPPKMDGLFHASNPIKIPWIWGVKTTPIFGGPPTYSRYPPLGAIALVATFGNVLVIRAPHLTNNGPSNEVHLVNIWWYGFLCFFLLDISEMMITHPKFLLTQWTFFNKPCGPKRAYQSTTPAKIVFLTFSDHPNKIRLLPLSISCSCTDCLHSIIRIWHHKPRGCHGALCFTGGSALVMTMMMMMMVTQGRAIWLLDIVESTKNNTKAQHVCVNKC